MFAIEISFKDGVSQTETLLVRRPQVLIGSSENAHVVIDDLADLPYQFEVLRGYGRRFRCRPVARKENDRVPALLEGSYEGATHVDLGSIALHITALDSDLALRESETPDRAGVRVLRRACATNSPEFPAVFISGSSPALISFVPDQPLYIGRSKECVLRIDSPEISSKHARIGFESGEFWIEDLGSTNGTFVNQQQVAGRINVGPGIPIILGREVTIYGVTSEQQLSGLLKERTDKDRAPAVRAERKYPVLVSTSEVARPARLVIPVGGWITIGRDPSSDMWLGAPHVSRKHCELSLSKTGQLQVVDQSTNGTLYDHGILRRGDSFETSEDPAVLDFGGGVTVALCFAEDQEHQFLASQGSARAFVVNASIPAVERPGTGVIAELRRSADKARGSTSEIRTHLMGEIGRFQELYQMYRGLTTLQKGLAVLWCIALGVVLVVVGSLLVGLIM